MKTKDLFTITAVAVGTAALTVAALLTNPLEAGDAANPLATTIATPKLLANGIELTLAPAANHDFKPGEPPAFELKAVNTLATPAEVRIRIALSALAPLSRLSRTPSIPSRLWQQEESFTLAPRETKSLTVATRTNLPANMDFSVALAQVDPSGQAAPGALPEFLNPGIVALRFSTATPKPAPADAATQLAVHVNPIPVATPNSLMR